MKRIFGLVLKLLGIVLILVMIAGYGFYTYLFEHEHEYFEVKVPEVKANLDKWQDQKVGLFMWGTYKWGVFVATPFCC